MKKLYNPYGDDTHKRMINGDTTNVFDLYNIKYKWAYNVIFKQMLENHWIPEKVNMSEDVLKYEHLQKNEKDAFLKILGFLIYLDSLQTNNIPNIMNKITASEVVLCLARQTFDEALHSRSYGYILTSLFDKKTAYDSIYSWRTYEPLRIRNEKIANEYQQFLDEPNNDELFFRALISNYILEGLFFYNGFIFFYNLAHRGLMMGTCSQIRYINRDELLHCELFRNIILEIKAENPDLFKKLENDIYELFETAVKDEINFSIDLFGDRILGISKYSIDQYSKYLANKRLKSLELKPIYDEVKNPYGHLEMIAGMNENENKNNIFSTRGISYKQSTFLDGWDKI